MTWEQAHRRHRLAHDIAADFSKGGPRALLKWRPQIEGEFGGLGGLLQDVQRRCHTAAEARLDAVLEASPADPEPHVRAVLEKVAEIYPDLRRLLDAHADHPALAEGAARFHRSVRAATGVDLGSRYEERGTAGDRRAASPARLRPVLPWRR